MRKNARTYIAFLFILISILFVSLTDKHFLIAAALLIFLVPIEGKIKSIILKKIIEALPLVYFILAILLGFDLFYTLSTLLIIVMMAKFVLEKKQRDYYEIFIVSILLILLTSVSTISINFIILLYLFLVFGALMLILSQYRSNTALERKLVLFVSIFSIISMLFALVVFFSIPRLSLGYLHGINLRTDTQSGFSKQVIIEKGKVDLNNQIVMRVLAKDFRVPLYLSGMHYTYFDGTKWRIENGRRKLFPISETNNFGITSGMVKSTIYLEPIGSDILFGPEKFVGVSGDFMYLKINQFHDFFTDSTYYKTIKYDAFSSIPGKTPAIQFSIPKSEYNQYLQLPMLSEEFIKIAKAAAKGKTEAEKIHSIVNYLKSHYVYSLNPTAQNIQDFVINHKSGYCEHFATAFVLFARVNHIPARLVSGFVTSEFNPNGEYFIVRERDAHTWAEVYEPEKGWTMVDPTPPAKLPTPSKLSLIIDSIKMSWYRNVVTYDSAKQMQMLAAVQKGISRTSITVNRGFRLFRKILRKWRLISIIITSIVLFFIIFKRKYQLSKNVYYNKIVSLIGSDKKESETLIEYAKRKDKLKELYPLIIQYYKMRFSKDADQRKSKNQLINLLRAYGK